MIDSNVSLDLMTFIEQNILPKYNEFGASHGLAHVQRVIKNSMELARKIGADVNMAYTVAAYHDIGMSGPRAIHHLTGGKILASDARLKRWFSPEQIRIMREAVEDHRASASHSPRSMYGKIVAEADRDLQPEHVFQRTVQFGLEQNPEKSRQEHWQRFQQHIEAKYGNTGYIKLWIANSPNHQYLKNIRLILEDKEELRKQFDYFFDKEKNGK
ncbi:HD domain-containing protein [Hoylesella timonensis]|uniref:HD domain-containing protein n=1 Tax=Hoylesella timonensis TaxID=386414 RepID=UPI00336A4656